MAYKPDTRKGLWKAQCASCGFVFNSNELKQRWDGVWVCEKDWEPRNILDFFKIPPDNISVPWVQKEAFNATNYASITSTDSPYTATVNIIQIDVNASGGNIIINLPLANTYTFAYTQSLTIRRTDSSVNTVTIQRQGGDTINGVTSETLAIGQQKIYQNDAISAWRNF